MLLVGLESHPENRAMDLLTFACDCGHYTTTDRLGEGSALP